MAVDGQLVGGSVEFIRSFRIFWDLVATELVVHYNPRMSTPDTQASPALSPEDVTPYVEVDDEMLAAWLYVYKRELPDGTWYARGDILKLSGVLVAGSVDPKFLFRKLNSVLPEAEPGDVKKEIPSRGGILISESRTFLYIEQMKQDGGLRLHHRMYDELQVRQRKKLDGRDPFERYNPPGPSNGQPRGTIYPPEE